MYFNLWNLSHHAGETERGKEGMEKTMDRLAEMKAPTVFSTGDELEFSATVFRDKSGVLKVKGWRTAGRVQVRSMMGLEGRAGMVRVGRQARARWAEAW